MKLTFYGSRGTIPFFGRNNIHYGGNTSCVRLDADGHTVILDCGSGLFQFLQDIEGIENVKLDILISHLHLDHIIGLSVFSPLWDENSSINLYTKSRGDSALASQVLGIFKPPYFPVDLEKINRSRMIEINENKPFMLRKSIKVIPFAANHHDETTSFRIEADKSLVYLLDYEADKLSESDKLVNYCKNADAVIFDCSYLPQDYSLKKGWGHSHYESGIRLAELSGCSKMIFAHFSQNYPDKILDYTANIINDAAVQCRLAFDGMEMEI